MSDKENFDAEDEQFEQFMNWMFNGAMPELSERLGSHGAMDELIESVRETFSGAIREPYQECLHSVRNIRRTKENPEGLTAIKLSKRFMMTDGNFSRWINGQQDTSLDIFCMVSAALDIEYPSGHVIALEAYESAIRFAAKSLNCDTEITSQEYLTVYHLFRIRSAIPRLLALRSGDDARTNQTVMQRTREHFPGANTTNIGQTAEKLRLPFIIIWKALPYGWF